jgi:hypothetical protein
VDIVHLQVGYSAVCLYDPAAHAFCELELFDRDAFVLLCKHIHEVLDVQKGTLLWMIAAFDKILQRYRDGESLVWKDAGVLTSTMTMTAEALGLNCCALGITGEPWTSSMLGLPDSVAGVGGLVIGSR